MRRPSEKMAVPVDIILHFFIGHQQGTRPRAGMRVRHVLTKQEGVVIGVTPASYAVMLVEETGQISYVEKEDLWVIPNVPRISHAEVLRKLQSLALGKVFPEISINMLLCFFNGNSGDAYRNYVAMAWGVVAFMRWSGGCVHEGLKEWAHDTFKNSILNTTEPYSVLPPELLAIVDHVGDDIPLIGKGDFYAAAERMLEYGKPQLAMADNLEALPDDEIIFGALAIDTETYGEVIVLGKDPMERDSGWICILDQEDGEVYSVPSEILDFLDEYEKPEDVEKKLRENTKSLILAVDFVLARPSDGTPSGQFLNVLLAGYNFRLWHKVKKQSLAKQAQKIMLANYRDLPKPLQSRAVALLPELVNTQSKQSHQPMGLHTSLEEAINLARIAHVDATRQRELTVTEDVNQASDEIEVLEISIPNTHVHEEAPPYDVTVANKLETGAAEELKQEVPAETNPGQVNQVSQAITFKSAARPLRFKFSHFPLLALEWPLPMTENAFQEAITTTLKWLSNRLGMTLPAHWNIGGHEIEHAGVRLEVEAAKALFAIRLEHPDTSHPTRTWRVEATVVSGSDGRGGMVGLRLDVTDRAELPPPSTSLPAIIKGWVDSPGLVVGDGLAQEFKHIKTEEDLAWLQSMIADHDREVPVWVINADTPFEAFSQAVGIGRFVLIDPSVKSEYQVQYGVLHIGELHHFAPKVQTITRHGLNNPRERQKWLNETIGSRLQSNAPTFREIRDAIRESREAAIKRNAASEPAIISSVNLQNEQQPDAGVVVEVQPYAYNDLKELLDLALDEKELLQSDLEKTKEELKLTRSRLHAVQQQLRPAGTAGQAKAAQFPKTLADLPQWAESIQGRVVFGDKAIRIATKTEHRDVEKIYAALQALHDHYWPMRWGNDDSARTRWLEFLKGQRMDFGPVGNALDNGRYSHAYQVTHGKRTLDMEYHIQGSSTRDPMRCIRIYMAIDEHDQKLIIGHMPGHLDNSHS